MAVDTTTDNLALTLQAPGNNNNTWGDVNNANLSKLEDAITETESIATTGGTTSLTTDQSRSIYLDVSGTLVSNAVINARDAKHLFIVKNNAAGSFTVTIQPNGGSGVEVTQGRAALVYLDGAGGASKILESGSEISEISPADGVFLVGDGSKWIAESGATARTSLGIDLAPYLLRSEAIGTIASAATSDIGGETAFFLSLTGSETITSLGTAANAFKCLIVSGTPTFTHDATSLIMPGGADYTAAAGDVFWVKSDASGNWRVISFTLASGKSFAGNAADIEYDNSTSGMTASDVQAAIDELNSGVLAATGEESGAHLSFTPSDHQTSPNNAVLKALLITLLAMDDSEILVAEKTGIHAKVPLFDRTGNEILAGFELPEQIITSSQSVAIPANITRVYMKVTGAGGGGSRYFGGIANGSSAGHTTATVAGTTFIAYGGTGSYHTASSGGYQPHTIIAGSNGSASGGTINTTGGGGAGGPAAGSAKSGGRGGYCEGEVTGLTPGETVDIVIGAPGSGPGGSGGAASVSLVFRGGTT